MKPGKANFAVGSQETEVPSFRFYMFPLDQRSQITKSNSLSIFFIVGIVVRSGDILLLTLDKPFSSW